MLKASYLVAMLGFVLVAGGCPTGGDDDASGDDDTTDPGCAEGFVLDPELPDEFLETYPDGCVPEACGVRQWGNLETDDTTIHVDAHAAEDGDGTSEAAFTSIQTGLDEAGSSGVTVAVAAGTYYESLTLAGQNNGVQLAGRCRELVVLNATDEGNDKSGIAANAMMAGHGWSISGLTVTGAPFGGIELGVGQLSVSSATLAHNSIVGVSAHWAGSKLFLEDVEILDTQRSSGGSFGRGIDIEFEASLEAINCLVEGNSDFGLFAASHGTKVSLTGVDIRETQPTADGTKGRGINVVDGAELEATDCRIEGNHELGIWAAAAGTTVVLTDVEVRETQTRADGIGGWGINIQEEASLDATNCLVEGNAYVGIIGLDAGTMVNLSNVEVRGTHRQTQTTVAQGLTFQEGASLIASDVIVTQTAGPGLMVSIGGTLSCIRCQLTDNTFAGAVVWSGGTLDLTDTTISGTSPDANEGGGIGIYASDFALASTMLLQNSTIENNPLAAIWLEGDGTYSIRNSTLAGSYGLEVTYPDGSADVWHGDGVVAIQGVHAWDDVSGLLLDSNTIDGAYRAGVFLDGSSAELTTNVFSNNATDLVWQHCDGVEEPGGLVDVSDVLFCPGDFGAYNLPVTPLEFNLYLEEGVPLKDCRPGMADDMDSSRTLFAARP